MAAFDRLDRQALDMLAYDIGDKVFDCGDYPMLATIDPDRLRAALPDFLRALGAELHLAPGGQVAGQPAAPAPGTPEFVAAVRSMSSGDLGSSAPAPVTPEFVRHNHDGGKAMPFGRKKPEGQCPRCDQLRAGADPREAHPAIQAGNRRREQDAAASAELRRHFEPGPGGSQSEHARRCGTGVTTCYDW